MGGRVLFEELGREGWAGVEALVTERRQESVHLDFKSPPTNPQHVDDLVGKALSGFANVEGGLLVIGIRTSNAKRKEPDRADAIVPVKDVDAVARRLDQRIASLTEPPVAAVQVKTIPDPSDPSRGVLLIYTPASDGGPHRDGTDRYMMRTGTNTEPMPHALLAAMFGRRPQPSLRLYATRKELLISNEGRGAAEDVFVRVSVDRNPHDSLLKGNSAQPPFELKIQGRFVSGDPRATYGLRDSRKRIFPGEMLVVATYDTPSDANEVDVSATLHCVDAPPVHVAGRVDVRDRTPVLIPLA